ncbi:MAG: transglutaminase family protein [Planctomycetota bacterium]
MGEVTAAEYRIRHETCFRYESAVPVCRNQIHLQPRLLHTATVHTHPIESELEVDPGVEHQYDHVDYFGNRVTAFSIERQHRKLTITSTMQVQLHRSLIADSIDQSPIVVDLLNRLDSGTDRGWVSVEEFRHSSPRIAWDSDIESQAAQIVAKDGDVKSVAIGVMNWIHSEFRYDATATQVHTPTHTAFQKRAGVCQDFAHIGIAMLRSQGVPARYVSGYLRTEPPPGEERLIGADQSHAWLSVYAGDQIGWLDIDPTNDCLVRMDHIPIAVGRDYGDVAPVRGVLLGGGGTTMKVGIDVQRL